MYFIDKEFHNIKGGFIHVPYDTQQVINKPAGTPSMPTATISDGLRYAIEAVIENKNDIEINAGQTH